MSTPITNITTWIVKCAHCGVDRIQADTAPAQCTRPRYANRRRTRQACGRLFVSVDPAQP